MVLTSNGGVVSLAYVHVEVEGFHDVLMYNDTVIFDSYVNSVGDTYSLGVIPAGQLLNFTLHNLRVVDTWSMGSGTGNIDGYVHAYVQSDYDGLGTNYVGWEDLNGTIPGDYRSFTYADMGFTITNTNAVAVPEPSVMALLGLGGLSLLRRRRK